MSGRQRASSVAEKANAIVVEGNAPIRASKLPGVIRFPLVVTLSMVLSSLMYSWAAEYIAGDLARVSRNLNEWWEVGVLVAWRMFELALGWYGKYDSYDIASLTLLSHGPFLLLLHSFYDVSASTAVLSLAINTLTTYIPFRLLRDLSPEHASSSLSNKTVNNQDIVTDFTIQALTTFLAASIYSVVTYAAYVTYLPVTLVKYFDDIPSVAAAHEQNYITLLPLTLIAGLAAKSFIFTPSTSIHPEPEVQFDPVTATFCETFKYNVWGYSSRVKTVLSRTAVLLIVTAVNTFVQVFGTIQGVHMTGAAAYTALWVVAAAVAGFALGVVGAV